MGCTADNLILQLRPKVIEVIAVPGYPNNQVLVFFRVPLCIPKGVGRYYVELDVVTIHSEVASD